MKKLFIAAFAVIAFTSVNAQDITYGLTGGLTNMNIGSGGDDESETGFHLGAFADFGISEKFHVQPELTYSNAGDVTFISLNAMAKYYVMDGLNLQAGPTLGIAGGDNVDAADENFGDDFTKLNIGLAFGVGYDISEKFFAQARYGVQLNDHVTDSDVGELKINNFLVGVGYRF
ncbi:porin family protein [Winogradskyella sp. UBA3174]|uniref:porin family protein n=1 Tax=Winogradskyella sp. UBA3174 TaxID=1947785 RepID=UPI0025EE74D3|nr:porin family protein [Winogradskyella sp. UBA3174]|tara:strand:+ start:3655 stop:4176 length:522 start_codon:yes stop_codon:yes gene_type:complete